MLKLSSVRAAALIFAAGALLCAVLFAIKLGEKEIRTGLLTYALMCAIAAFGLWRGRRWARNLGLIVAVANIGLGTIQLATTIFSREGSYVIASIVLAVSLLLSYLLSRPEIPA